MMERRYCVFCSAEFQPKEKGWNARYCSESCKLKQKRKRLKETKPQQLKNARRRAYIKTKKSPERLSAHRESANRYRRATRKWLADYKRQTGCVDCGYNAHPAALQLDHEGKKSVEISDARSSIARLKAEIDSGQCKVRCANCHSIKTWERKQK